MRLIKSIRGSGNRAFRFAHTLLACGLAIAAIVAVVPSGAVAELPQEFVVLLKDDDANPKRITRDALPAPTAFNFRFKSKTGSISTREFKGVPVAKVLEAATGQPLDPSVQYVKVRLDSRADDDSTLSLVPVVGADPEAPSLFLDEGSTNSRAIATPALVAGPAEDNGPIDITHILALPDDDPIRITPSSGRILRVKLSLSGARNKGKKLTAQPVRGETATGWSYQWYKANDKGGYDKLTGETGKSVGIQGDNATRTHTYRVVVTERGSDSMGTREQVLVSQRQDDGNKKRPSYLGPTGSSGNTGASGGTGGNNLGSGGGSTNGTGGTITPNTNNNPAPTPTPTNSTGPTQTPPPADPVPTPPPAADSGDGKGVVDTSGLIEAAKQASASGPLQTVNGVLLTPAANSSAASGGDGPGLKPLQQPPLQTVQNIFREIDDPRDLWPFLVAILFALGFSGAAREWIRP